MTYIPPTNADAGFDCDHDPDFDPAARVAVSTPFAVRCQLTQNCRPYTREEISRLPRGRCGVYVIWTQSEYDGSPAPLYAGKSETCVRRRLLAHLSPREPNPALRWELELMPDYIEFTVIFTASPEETDALETYIIQYMQPEANRAKTGEDGEERSEERRERSEG